MSHSVEKHLAVTPEEYDIEIRRFVPDYDAMIVEAVSALVEQIAREDGTILDLGAGTGALSAAMARRLPKAKLVLLDADAAMLEKAGKRLAAERDRIELREGTFAGALPRVDAAVASLSLHHVHDSSEKRVVYTNILHALAPRGVLVSCDAFVPADRRLAEPIMQRWAAHLVASGDTEPQAYARFADWAKEDRYLPLDQELGLLRDAGFAAIDVRWRLGPLAVVVARKDA